MFYDVGGSQLALRVHREMLVLQSLRDALGLFGFDLFGGGAGKSRKWEVGNGQTTAGEADYGSGRLTFSSLSVIALRDPANRKIFVEVGPVEAEGGKLDVVQLVRRGRGQTRIR
jgi:hypothetical protein